MIVLYLITVILVVVKATNQTKSTKHLGCCCLIQMSKICKECKILTAIMTEKKSWI